MRRLHTSLVLGLVLGLGCAGPGVTPPPAKLQVAGESKALAVAFDDIPAEVAKTVPLSLTASDGTGLALVSLRARAVLDDPLAFTELHLTFENPEARVLEGTFSIVLPQGAAISRFAMKNELGFQEGEVVEKQQARRAYEDFLHRRQDPALLEQAGGNEFSARVFPIPARAKKEIIVSFSQELSRRTPYVLPLVGLPVIESIDVEAHVAGRAAPVGSFSKRGVAPEADFRVDAKDRGDRAGVRNGNLVLARVTPIVGSQPEPLGATMMLVDTSASRALGMVEQGRLVKRLCAQIARAYGPQTRVVVAAYDQEVEPVFSGAAGDFGDGVIDRLRQRLALGASNLDAALAWAEGAARGQGIGRVVLVTDGVVTAGETAGQKLRARVADLAKSGVARLDVVALGGIRDDDLLKSLVNAGLPRGGVVVDPVTMGEEDLWRRLNEATRSGVEVKVDGAVFTFPERVDGVQSGDEVLVYANVPDDRPVRISVGGGPFTEPALVKVERPLLERAWVGAKIKSLVERERTQGASESLSKEIVGLSTKYRVLSPKTALLVLETDRDYARFGIDRKALADILVADAGKVSLQRRTLPDPPKPPPPQVVVAHKPPPPKVATKGKRSFDVNLDGGGSSGGVGSGAHASGGASAPAARPTAAAPAARPPAPDPVRADREDGAKDAKEADDSRPATSRPAEPMPAPTSAPPTAGGAAGGVPGGVVGGVVGGVLGGVAAGAPAGAPGGVAAPASRADGHEVRDGDHAPAPPPRTERPEPRDGDREAESSSVDRAPPRDPLEAYTGPFKTIMGLVARGQAEQALVAAFDWRKSAPGDVMALIALGEAFEAASQPAQAARCYGSLVDLFPGRADVRRFAGERLERLASKAALDLAADTYQKAEIERPDHPASHRLHAFALLKQGKPERAFEAIVRGLRQPYPSDRFRGVNRILREDLGLVGAAWARAEPAREEEVQKRVRDEGGSVEDQPSLRFVLNWETDANDVDFHIHDAKGGHAFYSHPTLPSGGELYADVTTGYGPECFTIRAPPGRRAGPYRLQAHYYSRGPMGYGMGKLQIIDHDGRGGLTFEERPFVVMVDSAFVDLGVVAR